MLKNTIEGRLSILKDSKNCFIVLHVTWRTMKMILTV
jgi:hypothetical protein